MKIKDFPNLKVYYSTVKDSPQEDPINFKKFLNLVGTSFENTVKAKIEHKDKVLLVDFNDRGKTIPGDALITQGKNVYLAILTADCLPISIYDPKTSVISLVHLSNKNKEDVLVKTIETMKKEFKTDTKNLIIEIGPSICSNHYQANLWDEAEKNLMELGVNKENINNEKICTFESSDFFSHRKAMTENGKDPRFATVFGKI